MFEAFILEFRVINQMARAMGRPELFRDEFGGDRRPKTFGWLVRPTAAAFSEFVLTLDKMMSDNLNKKFFGDEVPSETEEARRDGKIVVQARGTIAMLEEWVRKYYRPAEPKPLEEMIAAFKEVRKARQQPAHAIKADEFDKSLPVRQRELMSRAYTAVRTLRLVLANHPAVRTAGIEISTELREGKIWPC